MEGDFNRVDRERWPDLAQQERIGKMLETQSNRAEKLGFERGKLEMKKMLETQSNRAEKLGFERGKLEMVERLLLEGVGEQIICKVAQLSQQELAQIKRSLD
ncbi:MAG: hypothetical protein OYH77_03940 [Pseudomonadota bacterium]|nr:hypothetical protein [Pseudomonadota bacterium]